MHSIWERWKLLSSTTSTLFEKIVLYYNIEKTQYADSLGKHYWWTGYWWWWWWRVMNDLMCAWKLSRGQLSLAHSSKVKQFHARENQSWSPWSQSGGWKGRRTMEERTCGKDGFWAWSGREKEWWMVTVVMKEMMNWCEWDQMRVIGLHDQQASKVP